MKTSVKELMEHIDPCVFGNPAGVFVKDQEIGIIDG